jgi:hypothetical protein
MFPCFDCWHTSCRLYKELCQKVMIRILRTFKLLQLENVKNQQYLKFFGH